MCPKGATVFRGLFWRVACTTGFGHFVATGSQHLIVLWWLVSAETAADLVHLRPDPILVPVAVARLVRLAHLNVSRRPVQFDSPTHGADRPPSVWHAVWDQPRPNRRMPRQSRFADGPRRLSLSPCPLGELVYSGSGRRLLQMSGCRSWTSCRQSQTRLFPFLLGNVCWLNSCKIRLPYGRMKG